MASSERTDKAAGSTTTAASSGTISAPDSKPSAAAPSAANTSAQSSASAATSHAVTSAGAGADQTAATGISGVRSRQRGQGEDPIDTSGPEAPAPTLDSLRVSCLMNSRYHASREAFLDTVHRWFMFAVIALGTAAVINVLPPEMFGFPVANITSKVFAACTGIIAALDLTFDLSNRARTHAMMKRRYFELIADVIENKRTLIEASACLNRYSADEEPAYHTLLISSWNDAQEMVYGDEADHYEIPARHLRFKNVWRYIGENYPLSHGPNLRPATL